MGFFVDFGAGVFNKANQVQDENRKEASDQRKMYMNTWTSTVLPQVMKQRQLDDQSLNLMNQYSALDDFQGQPEMAFYAAKAVSSGQYRNINDFLDSYNRDPGATVPPQILEAQKASLAKTFSYDTDQATGKVSNFAFKSQPTQTMNTKVPAGKRSLSDILMGKVDPGANVQEARQGFASGTGIDPLAPTGSRFDTAPTSGTINLKPIDKKQEAFDAQANEVRMRMLDKAKNLPKAMEALSKGPQELAKWTATPGNFYTREELASEEFNQGIQQTLLKDSLEYGSKNPGAIGKLLSGRMTGPQLAEYFRNEAKTPEEKAEWDDKRLAAKGILSPNGTIGWLATLNDPKAMEIMFPNEADRNKATSTIQNFIQQQLMSDQMKMITALGQNGKAPGSPPPASQTIINQGQQQPAPAPAAAQPAPAAPEEEDQIIERLPGAFDIDEDSFKPEPPPRDPRNKTPKRLGESWSGNTQVNVKTNDAVINADTDMLTKANPFAVLRSLNDNRSKVTDPSKIIKSLRFNENDQNKLKDQQFRDSANLKQYKEFTPKFKDVKEASKNLEVGQLGIVNGQFLIMTQAFKSQYGE